MRLGVNIGYWGLTMGPDEQLLVAKEAEQAGYDSVWAAEAYGSDAATVLAWIAGQTSTIKLGAAIFQMPARSPAMTAMTAATLDQLSGGRMLLGLGSSGPQVAEGWHGQRFAKQLQRTREYVEVVRMALARERLVYSGETLGTASSRRPWQGAEADDLPEAGAHPDLSGRDRAEQHGARGRDRRRVDPDFFSPAHVGEFRAALEEGAARVGRSLDGFDIAPVVCAHVADDIDLARDFMRPGLALYVGGMGSRSRNFYKR